MVNEQTQQCIWLEDYASDTFLSTDQVLDHIRLLLFDHPVLSYHEWKGIKVLINSYAFTLIPERLFRKEYVTEYLRLALGRPLLPTEKVLVHPLPDQKAFNVFSVPVSWWEFFQEYFGLQTVAFFPTSGAVIKGAGDRPADRRLIANVEEAYLTLVLFQKDQLLFCNKFRYANGQEATFFVLSCLNQLNYLPEEVCLVLNGEITPFSEMYTELSRFLPDIRFGSRLESLTFIPEFEDLADHRYFGLLNLIRL